ncbi:MAG: DUF5615 family PIN-like protein [Candidatus Binataceae bacterium]
MDLLIDECVPASVTKVFAERGHRIVYVARELGQSSPDRLVAETADEHGLSLITWNVKDFRALGLLRRPRHNQQQFRHAGMISFLCGEDQGARRAKQVIESIEFEFVQASRRADPRLLVSVYIDRLIIHF